MILNGFLIISDITGYSAYLNKSELDHARDSLTDLLKLLVEHNKSPLIISKLEGDAVFSYVKDGGIKEGQTLLEIIETTYAAFRKALELMVINTTCTCNACRNLPNLDLKFFVHYGQFSTQQIGDYQELVGNDVNLAHRILKNNISGQFDIIAYAAYTRSVLDALDWVPAEEILYAHQESFPDVGTVDLYIQDMHRVWKEKKEEVRMLVTPEEAMVTEIIDFPVPPPILWDYITKPEYRVILYDSDTIEVSNQNHGRIGKESIYTCDHGDNISVHKILDWNPFEQYTYLEDLPVPGVSVDTSYHLETIGDGSKVTICWSYTKGPWLLRKVADWIMKTFITRIVVQQSAVLREKILDDIENGETGFEISIKINPDLITSAVGDALHSNMAG